MIRWRVICKNNSMEANNKFDRCESEKGQISSGAEQLNTVF